MIRLLEKGPPRQKPVAIDETTPGNQVTLLVDAETEKPVQVLVGEVDKDGKPLGRWQTYPVVNVKSQSPNNNEEPGAREQPLSLSDLAFRFASVISSAAGDSAPDVMTIQLTPADLLDLKPDIDIPVLEPVKDGSITGTIRIRYGLRR